MPWHSGSPIYAQLAQQISAAILDGTLAEGQALPSVRQIAGEQQINPLTVQRALAQLADNGVIEKRRGQGSVVKKGAKQRLLTEERALFLNQQWPHIKAHIKRLGLSVEALVKDGFGEDDGHTD
ncbi:GntR family transcriptional regulator [Gallaecimonas mangrovi]|uniref:GntR family transcriptional regulator n=1 Tax=Gallaecimonas mangrovi TaxID=2291597 RepID=UPI000E20A333|nr:GntR family transcriptional regulator [Gallaecimonas mangrovi]